MSVPNARGGCRSIGGRSFCSGCALATAGAAALMSATAPAQTVADFFPEVAKLVASDGVASDALGTSVAIDGDTMVVGSPGGSGLSADSGCAYVFERQATGTWLQTGKLIASDGVNSDKFGASVAIEGNTIVVGASHDDTPTAADHGSAYVFERQANGTWPATHTSKLMDSTAENGLMGGSVSIDAGTIVVGAMMAGLAPTQGGAALLFTRQANGSWPTTETARLLASDAAMGDRFGASVCIDAGTLVVGAYDDDTATVNGHGSAYVFERQANGTWLQTTKLLASPGQAGASLGYSAYVDAGTIVVGAYAETATAAYQGAAYVFDRQANGSWPSTQSARLVASDGGGLDNFGTSVSIDVGKIAVGAHNDYTDGMSYRGSAYVFDRQSSGAWLETAKLLASDGAGNDRFGNAVSIDGGMIVVGAKEDDTGAVANNGSAYVFDYSVARNLDAGNLGYTSLSDAISEALPGEHIAIRNQALQVSGILDASSKQLTFVGVEPLTAPSELMLLTADGTAFVKSPDVAAAGLSVAGTLVAPQNGTLVLEDLSVTSAGRVLQQGATLLVSEDCRTETGGICYLSGHVLADVVATAVGGQNRVAEDTDIFSNYTNAGTTIIQRGTLYIYGNLTNTGTMVGDVNTGLVPPTPGDGFNVEGDYVVGAGASLTMPDPAWWLRVGGNLDIAINDPTHFVMDQATIELTGLGAAPFQTLEVLSADLGALQDGFATANFPIGALRVRAGAVAYLVDAHDNAAGRGAEVIYTHSLVVPKGATLVTGGTTIYTESATIGGTVSNPADIVVVDGAPACPGDLSGDGEVNGQDLSGLLVMWGQCGGNCPGDLNADGAVDGVDLSLMLTAWGSCNQ